MNRPVFILTLGLSLARSCLFDPLLVFQPLAIWTFVYHLNVPKKGCHFDGVVIVTHARVTCFPAFYAVPPVGAGSSRG